MPPKTAPTTTTDLINKAHPPEVLRQQGHQCHRQHRLLRLLRATVWQRFRQEEVERHVLETELGIDESCCVDSARANKQGGGKNPDDLLEFTVSRCQLGFTDMHSVKGQSKLVYSMSTVDNFMKTRAV